MDAREIQDLIDRLEALKLRHAALIDEQIKLTKKVAGAVVLNDDAHEFQAGQRAQMSRERDSDRQARRDSR